MFPGLQLRFITLNVLTQRTEANMPGYRGNTCDDTKQDPVHKPFHEIGCHEI